MSKTDYNFEKQLPIEQLVLLSKQSIAAFAATMAVLFYLVFKIYEEVNTFTLSLWVGGITLLNIYLLIWMYFVHRATIKNNIDTRKARRFIFIYQIQSILHGSTWGFLPFLLIEIFSPEMKFFAYIILCGMAAGAIGTTGMIYRIYLSIFYVANDASGYIHTDFSTRKL